jgi:hypothetical protein
MKNRLVEGEDFYYSEDGYMVLTRKYHLERGFCCGNGCTNCPFDYAMVHEPKRTELLQKRKQAENKG